MTWRSSLVTWRHRLANAWRDSLDRSRGYCCAMPVDTPSGSSGGYHFWRCGLRRGHEGRHRSVNYLWDEDGGQYSPLDKPPSMPKRYPTMTRKQRRARDRWYNSLASKR